MENNPEPLKNQRTASQRACVDPVLKELAAKYDLPPCIDGACIGHCLVGKALGTFDEDS